MEKITENNNLPKYKDNEQYEICSPFKRSLAAFIDYLIIFVFFYIISLFFKQSVNSFIDLKFNSLINNNINDVNAYSDPNNGIDLGGFIDIMKQLTGDLLNDIRPLIYISMILYFSFWGMVVSFLFIGKTPGSKLLKINLFDKDVRTREADIYQKSIRFLIYFLDFFFIFGVGTLFAFFNKDKRGISEILSGTIVLTKK